MGITYNLRMTNAHLLEKINLRPKTEEDISWLDNHMLEEWGGEPVLTHENTYFPTQLPGFLAVLENEIVGEVIYSIENDRCEVVTLSSLREGSGIGTALLTEVEKVARTNHCSCLHLFTTTDNLDAVGFYQKRGFRITVVLSDAMDAVREIKPQVSRIGMNGIPLQDGLILEKKLT